MENLQKNVNFHFRRAKQKIDEQDPSVKDLNRLDEIILKNLSRLAETDFKDVKYDFYDQFINGSNHVFSQVDIAMVQSAFFASLVIFPRAWGVSKVAM